MILTNGIELITDFSFNAFRPRLPGESIEEFPAEESEHENEDDTPDMITRKLTCTFLALTLLFSMANLTGCSKSGEGRSESGTIPQVSQQALDATREYRDKTIKDARMTHTLGDERTQAIDNALKQ